MLDIDTTLSIISSRASRPVQTGIVLQTNPFFKRKICPMSKKSPLTPVGEILEKTLKSLPVTESFRVYPIWKNWETLVGPAVALKTSPDFVRGKILFVSVENSVWLHQLNFEKGALLEKISALHPDEEITDIRFRLRRQDFK